MYSGEYDVCDVTLSVYPHRASLKNMLAQGGNRTKIARKCTVLYRNLTLRKLRGNTRTMKLLRITPFFKTCYGVERSALDLH
jgi:hypothetical protein